MSGPFDRKRIPSTSPGTPARSPSRSPSVAIGPAARPSSGSAVSRSEEDEARSSSKYRAALEALFAPKQPQAQPEPLVERSAKKVVTVPSREDPRGPERDKRLAKLLAAEGRAAVTKTAEDFANAGFDFPRAQEVMLKLLDHDRDDRVRGALEALASLLDEEAPQRRAVLDARLRRLESDADDSEVRALAASLRRRILSRTGR
jgi:hypothetical protein